MATNTAGNDGGNAGLSTICCIPKIYMLLFLQLIFITIITIIHFVPSFTFLLPLHTAGGTCLFILFLFLPLITMWPLYVHLKNNRAGKYYVLGLFILEMMMVWAMLYSVVDGDRIGWPNRIDPLTRTFDHELEENGIIWAVLIAGSRGFINYRHQADVCHAYQLLKRGGLKDKNIVVFMYDDIAWSFFNPRPGVLINHPNGPDVYAGVPKDYTGKDVTAINIYAVLLGDKSAIKSGSGKVVDSKPHDRIFVYYSGHGDKKSLGMPDSLSISADALIKVLKKKHASKTYKKMVMYIEACRSGSMFAGLMPENLNIYVTTAANPNESSYATYCPTFKLPSPPGYGVCIANAYSAAWMEDSESSNTTQETLKQQYEQVKEKVIYFNDVKSGSHVMEYGDKSISSEKVSQFQGCGGENLHPSK